MFKNLKVGQQVQWDTFEGIKAGTVTAVGVYWVEVDGRTVDTTTVLVPA